MGLLQLIWRLHFASVLVGNTHEGGTTRWKFARGCDVERLILTELASLAEIK